MNSLLVTLSSGYNNLKKRQKRNAVSSIQTFFSKIALGFLQIKLGGGVTKYPRYEMFHH